MDRAPGLSGRDPLFISFSTPSLPDSIPKNTLKQPACFMSAAVARSKLSTRPRHSHPKRSRRRAISSQISVTLAAFNVNTSSANEMRS